LESGSLVLDQLFLTWNHGAGREVRFPVYSIFVDHPDGRVLIDTGFDKAWVERVLPFEKPMQEDDQKIVNQLAKIGVRPEDVDIVVNSHLHFDHCSGNRYFPGAKFIMTKEELRHAFVPDPWERLGYDRTLIDMPGAKMQLLESLGDSEHEVLPGITLIETPGHSKGHLSLIVRPTNDQPMIFPIDVAYTAHNLYDRVLMGLHSDPEDLLRSMQRVENYARKIGGKIFFSHDAAEYATYKKAPEFYGE
ncbi:MAG: N-acyl homoserine lactonase family protein, partial [Thermomicrobiales bacterium]